MKHTVFALLVAILFSACSRDKVEMSSTPKPLHLEFLTRKGCMNTAAMLGNLQEAIKLGKVSADYDLIDQGTLRPDDSRTGYPTPTLLLNGKDVFGLPAPEPPFPEPA